VSTPASPQLVAQRAMRSCVSGRCPCWPQDEPFDTAEMNLLATVQKYIDDDNWPLWDSIQTQTLAGGLARRAYVLSTLVCPVRYGTYTISLLGWVRCDPVKVQWLLDVGVCPNISGTHRSQEAVGWTGGPVHPDRPPQRALHSPLYDAVIATRELLLAAGAYPRLMGIGAKHVTTLRQRWHAWHGRLSRRVWVSLTCPDKES
jgi:hypothetical protein